MSFAGLSFATMAIIGVVSSIVIARLYGVRVIGEFALAAAPASALLVLSTVKEQTALIKRLTALEPRDPRVTGLWAAVFTFSQTLTVVVSAIAAGISYLLFHGPIDHPELWWPSVVALLGYAFIFNVGWNLDGVFSAFVAGRELFWIRLHQALVMLACNVIFAIVLNDVYGLIFAMYYVSPATSLIHRAVLVRRYMRLRVPRAEVREGFRILPEIIRFGLRMSPGSMAQGASNQSPTWMLGVLGNVTAVGAFNRAQTLSLRFHDLTYKITEMLFPTLVARRAAGDGPGFDRVLIDTMRYSTLIMLCIASVGGGGALGIMELFGPGFVPAAPAFTLLIFLPTLTTLAVIQSQVLFAVDRPGTASLVTIGRLIVTLAVGFTATHFMGLAGPAVGLLVGCAFDVLLKAIVVRPYLTHPVRHLWTPRQWLAAVVAYAGGFGAARAVHEVLPALPALPLVLGAGAIAFIACFVLVGGFNERDRERLQGATRGRMGALLGARAG
jgi:O-antigen/teichoic acid export membrane protein